MLKTNIILFIAIILNACATTSLAPNKQISILQIPPQYAFITTPMSERMELREGPGHRYKIKETIEDQHTKLLVLGNIKAWTKIFILSTQKTGWVHTKSIFRPRLNTEEIVIEAKSLPVFFAKEPINHNGYSIQKGDVFYGIRNEKNRLLVWSQELKAFIWLEKQKMV